MFLFNKRTKNIIKYAWGIMATLIVLSMVVSYSGFATLAGTPKQAEQIEIPEEVRAQLLGEEGDFANSTSSKEQAVLDAIESGKIQLGTSSDDTPLISEDADSDQGDLPPTPSVPELKLEI